jgi:Family of unknown function (DUF5641)
LVALPEPDFAVENPNRLRRWQLLQQLTQHFWARWSTEYLTTLQRRAKLDPVKEINVGMLVVVREDHLPSTQWLLGRIIGTKPGADGVVRVATIKTKNGLFDRPVVKLSILPVSTSDNGE